MIEVIRAGTKIKLVNGPEAIVVGAFIKEGAAIQYQCSWWSNGEHYHDFFGESEIETVIEKKYSQAIGFYPDTSTLAEQIATQMDMEHRGIELG